MIKRLLFALALFASPATAQTVWGVQCTPNAPPCTSVSQAVTVAQRLHASIYRVRVGIPHPITDTRSGATTVAQQDVDPIVDAIDIKLASTTGFQIGDNVTMDLLPANTTITNISGFVITVSGTGVSQYLNAAINYGVLGPGGLYQALATATPNPIPIELTIFNAVNGKASDTSEIGCTASNNCPASSAAYQADLAYMFDTQITGQGLPLPALVSADNEEDGGSKSDCQGVPNIPQNMCPVSLDWNGETAYDAGSTPWWYFPKLHDVIAVAHARGIKVMGSGITILGSEITYWNNLWGGCISGVCTCQGLTNCRLAADLYQQGGFSRSLKQSNLAANLPNSCNVFSPPLGGAQTNRVGRVTAILNDEATAGVDYTNFHWYDIPWQYQGAAFTWASSVTGHPLVFDEWAPYSLSAVDMVQMANGLSQVNAAYAVEWDQESAGSYPQARSLANPDGTLRGSALWYLAYLGYTGPAYSGGPTIPPYPNLFTGPAVTLPFPC